MIQSFRSDYDRCVHFPRRVEFVLIAALCLAQGATAYAQASVHPLDPLTAEEYLSAVRILGETGRIDAESRFVMTHLHEPPKSEVLAWSAGQPYRREAFAVIKQGARTFEAVLDLSERTVLDWREREGVQPALMDEELAGVSQIVRANEEWREAMRKRGITDFSRVFCASLSAGYYGAPEEEGRRLIRVQSFDFSEVANFWGRPIEGVTTIVDLNEKTVLEVIDTGVVPIPKGAVDYDADSTGPRRKIPSSIGVSQSDGPSFRVEGHQVRWQKWRFHFRMDPRVGIVISTVSYADGDRVRSVLYQMSFSELFVPYMDPSQEWYYRTYFDGGEYGIGSSAVALVPGEDCPENAVFFDAVLADNRGKPRTKARLVALFERQTGNVAWRHTSLLNGKSESRRSRELVVRMAATIGNYDYIMDWIFRQNGSIRIAVGATGIPEVKAVASRGATAEGARSDDRYGRFVAENTVAVNHDHFFSFRIDLDVDGTRNSFVRTALVRESAGRKSKRKSLWVLEPSVARSEKEAKLGIDLERPSLWRVVNPNVRGPVGYPTSFQISPGPNARVLISAKDPAQRRAGFTEHHLWVTPYRTHERYAAGDYPNQSRGGEGLPEWTSADRPIENTDIVVWYTLGFHHVVRAEDWPVMPTKWGYVDLRPFDFFARNPAIDLPAGGGEDGGK